jgi:hypothetical protein
MVMRQLAARKAQGAKLGNPRNAPAAAAAGRAVQVAEADRFAANVLPIVIFPARKWDKL